MGGSSKRKRALSTTRKCPHCGDPFDRQGWPTHTKACQASNEQLLKDEKAIQEFFQESKKVPRKRRKVQKRQPSPEPAPQPGPLASTSQTKLHDIVEDLPHEERPRPVSPVHAIPSIQHGSPRLPSEHEILTPPLFSYVEDFIRAPTPDVDDVSIAATPPDISPPTPPSPGSPAQQLDDLPEVLSLPAATDETRVKIEYHPRSGQSTKMMTVDQWLAAQSKSSSEDVVDDVPWEPFESLDDFELADLVLQAGLTRKQTERLLAIICRLRDRKSTLTIFNYKRLCQAWENATVMYPAFETHTFETEYHPTRNKTEVHEYTMPVRDLWEWCMKLIEDPVLAKHFEWNAKRLYRSMDGAHWEQFWVGPTSGSTFWRVQSRLPGDGLPFGIILYADKSRWTSFGTKKGHPIIARIANLDKSVRHGAGIGGGRIVGFLPVLDDPSSEHGKPKWVDFKRAVWHDGFWEVLESIAEISKTGVSVKCGDNIIRRLFPFIHILVADYEEHEVRSSLTWHARALVRNGKRYNAWESCFDTSLLTPR